MKTIQLFMSFSLAVLSILHGQENQLVLTNMKTHIERAIEPGKTIRVKRGENLRSKGELIIIDSEKIAVGKDTIPISEIAGVNARTVDSRSSGVVLIALGVGVTALSIAAMYELSLEGGVIGCILGGGMMGGGIKKLIVGQSFRNEKWAYTIRQPGVSSQ